MCLKYIYIFRILSCLINIHVLSHFSLTLCDPMNHNPPDSSVHGDSPGKNTGVGCHALLQGIFTNQGSNPHLSCPLHWQLNCLPQAPPGKPLSTRKKDYIFK